MRCCVPGCKNDSKHISKSQGITFHAFPTTPSLRASWVKALGKPDWQPKERSAVCSEHFYYEDLYFTKSGLRKVKTGAVPCVVGGFQATYNFEEANVEICRMCLISSTNLNTLKHYKLEEAFEHLTGIMLNEEERLSQSICGVCAYRLANYSKFRRTTIQANTVLLDVLRKNNCISSTFITDNYNCLTNFGIKHLTSENYDYNFEFNEKDFIEKDSFEKDYSEKDKDEIKIDNIDIKDEQENLENIEFVDEITKYSDTEVNANDFDSEDSLPLEVTRKKKRKEVKKKKIVEPKIDRRRKPFLNSDLNETLFNIIDLTYEEQIAEIEKRQETDNYRHAVYKCTECYKGFLDQAAYNSHMVRHTNESGTHRCGVCKTHFRHAHALRKHITAHHTQRFSCKQCVYVTTHRQTARLHERWHRGTKYCCPHCPDEFLKFTTYMGHVRIKHPSDFVCALCGYSFVSAKGIDLHKKLKHRGDAEIPLDGPFCELCNVRFASEEAYQKHLSISARHENKNDNDSNKPKKRRTRETREKSSKEIDETDEEKRKLYQSQARKAEGPIPCEQCGLQLEDSRAYHGHFRRMHPDKNRTKYPSMKSPCMCEVCGRIFQSFALLKDHRWTHTGERPFSCAECGKQFRMKQRLVAHRRLHSNHRAVYDCHVCGKHFSTHSNRQRHMFIHTGLKPFACELCGKGFKHSSEKRAHITYVHLKKPWPKRTRGKRGAQGSAPPPAPPPDMELPMWSSCDPKMADMNIMEDKPVYYNLKL